MHKRRKLIWHIFPPFAGILLVALIATALYASTTIKNFYLHRTYRQLESHAWHIGTLLPVPLLPENFAAIQEFCVNVGAQLSNRITVILPSGQVIGDSLERPENMDNHRTRPEIYQAFDGFVGTSLRYSATLEEELVYVAVPFHHQGEIVGVVRTSMSVKDVKQALQDIYRQLMLAGGLVGLFSIFISLLISQRIGGPLETIRQGALRFARGELHHKIRGSWSEEIGILAETMNQMASQLSERISTIVKQRNELEAVLENMVEAVIILDLDERIIQCNQAAIQLFQLKPHDVGHRYLQEMIRNADIHKFVQRAFEHEKSAEDVVCLYRDQERFLHVHGTFLYDTNDTITEMLLVFHDITRLKQLENMRREFVANVSHELRTPITSIIGFIETLQDGAIHDPETAQKFLGIIQRNASRLNSIITDLLTLSRIEHGHELERMTFTRRKVRDIVEAAVLACEQRARNQQVTIQVACEEEIVARVNADLLEQAVVNLLDNAIKYSPKESEIHVTVSQHAREVRITVRDFGCGIPADHLPRLFERFYRVDKARSRKLGGTGLGLAIVKHIANAHRGRATVSSTPGKGSTFSLIIPVE